MPSIIQQNVHRYGERTIDLLVLILGHDALDDLTAALDQANSTILQPQPVHIQS